jgi:signal peptidase I
MTDDKQGESVKTYRPWVGVVLSFFIAGTSQFLAGKQLVGIGWFASIVMLKLAGVVCLANPRLSGDILGITLLLVSLGVWIAMLIQSYRPVPKFRWLGWLCFVILFFAISNVGIAGLKIFVRPFSMPTGSMSPTIQGSTKRPDGTTVSGDHVFAESYAYWFSEPQRGDIVVFETKGISEDGRELFHIPLDELYVKRIVGVPGDVLSIQNGRLCNHNQILSEPAGLAKLKFNGPQYPFQIYLTNSTASYTVPSGNYFVIGDNTTNSLDSRFWGAIPEKNIIGRVSKIYWPLNHAGKVE